MGYRTSYYILTDHLDPTLIDLVRKNIDKLREMSEKDGDKYSYALSWGGSGWSGNSYEWDNYYGDMLELSKVCPNIRLTIRGEGEETEDIWEEHFLNGKSYSTKAKIIFDEFDPKLLETVEERERREKRERIERETGKRERRELDQHILPSLIQLPECTIGCTIECTIGGTLEPDIKALEARLAEQYLAK